MRSWRESTCDARRGEGRRRICRGAPFAGPPRDPVENTETVFFVQRVTVVHLSRGGAPGAPRGAIGGTGAKGRRGGQVAVLCRGRRQASKRRNSKFGAPRRTAARGARRKAVSQKKRPGQQPAWRAALGPGAAGRPEVHPRGGGGRLEAGAKERPGQGKQAAGCLVRVQVCSGDPATAMRAAGRRVKWGVWIGGLGGHVLCQVGGAARGGGHNGPPPCGGLAHGARRVGAGAMRGRGARRTLRHAQSAG